MLDLILQYLKGVVGAVGAVTLPPIFDWLVGYLPAPPPAHVAIVTLLVALFSFGTIVVVPNKPKGV